jgi:hypothetical protein
MAGWGVRVAVAHGWSPWGLWMTAVLKMFKTITPSPCARWNATHTASSTLVACSPGAKTTSLKQRTSWFVGLTMLSGPETILLAEETTSFSSKTTSSEAETTWFELRTILFPTGTRLLHAQTMLFPMTSFPVNMPLAASSEKGRPAASIA